MLLKNKIAIIYGAGGAVGSAVAIAFAREGAFVMLTGRTDSSLEIVANKIREAGGQVETAVLDASNQEQVVRNIEELVAKKGSIDISFNLIGMSDEHGKLLTEMTHHTFVLPISTAMKSHFITATTAARGMRKQGNGVILALTANAARKPYPVTGGFGVACAAIEALCRQLAVEEGEYGTRVVCLRSAGSPDAPGVAIAFKQHAEDAGISVEDFEKDFAKNTMLKRLPRLAEIADTAVLMASDRSSAVTAAVINLTCGELAD